MNKKILLFTDDNGIPIDATAMQELRVYINDCITGTDYGLSYGTLAMEWTKKLDPNHVGYVLLLNANENQIQTVLFKCPRIEAIYNMSRDSANQWEFEMFEIDEGEVINNTEHSGLPNFAFLKQSDTQWTNHDQPLPFTVNNGIQNSNESSMPFKNVSNQLIDDTIPYPVPPSEGDNYEHPTYYEDEQIVDPLNPETKIADEVLTKKIEDKNHQDETENDVNYKRTRTIQKQLFARQEWQTNKTIGVWSPIHQTGVTTFVLNFALYLAKHRIYTGILEGLTSNHILKYWLNRYTDVPNNWVSYATVIHDEIEPTKANWIYGNVLFLPLQEGDIDHEWTTDTLESYFKMPSILDIVLVDLPTGEMNKHTLDSLLYLSELWIIVDDSFHEIIAWKEYINQLHEIANTPIKLIFNKKYDFSQIDRLEKELGYPIITSLPSLHEEVKRNYYQTKPLIENELVYNKLESGFYQIRNHLFGDSIFNTKSPIENPSIISRAKSKIKKSFRFLIEDR